MQRNICRRRRWLDNFCALWLVHLDPHLLQIRIVAFSLISIVSHGDLTDRSPDNPNQTRAHEVSRRFFRSSKKLTTSDRLHRKFSPCQRPPPTDGTLRFGPPNVFGQNSTCPPPNVSTPHSLLWENFSTISNESAWQWTCLAEDWEFWPWACSSMSIFTMSYDDESYLLRNPEKNIKYSDRQNRKFAPLSTTTTTS